MEDDPLLQQIAFVTSQLSIAALTGDADAFEARRDEVKQQIESVGAGQDTSQALNALAALPYMASEEETGQAMLHVLEKIAALADGDTGS